MTHRTIQIGRELFNVFDSQPGAEKFKAEHPDTDINVVVRRRSLFMRAHGVEMTIIIGGTVADPRQGRAQAAGQTVLDEVEAMIAREVPA